MRKLKLLLAAAALLLGVSYASAQIDVTASYIGDVTWIVNGGGHSHGSQNHAESAGIGWWNSQTLVNGWHAFAAPNAEGGAGESWQSGFGSAGVMMGRTMVLPEGNYTLSFDACGMNATNSAEPSATPVAGDAVAFLTGQTDVDITNSTPGDNTFHSVSFTFDVTTANTAYEFGIKKVADGSKIDWCQIKNVRLTLNSTNIYAVANNSITDFTYSGEQTWHTNTWSTEGQRDGSRFQVPFHELWTGSGGKLADATIKGTYTPTESGVYKVSAWVRAMNESGGAVTGAKIFVGDVEADACSGSVVYDGKGRLGTYTAMADGVAGTAFEYGFILENAAINWLAFKNVTITYLGSMPQAEIDALLALVPTGAMNASVKSTLDGLVDAFQDNASVSNYNALSLYLPTAEASVAIYADINTAISSYATKAAALDAAGVAAYDASGIQTKYDNGTYETLAEAESELAAAFTTAVKAQTTVGSDWTGLIVNPSFESDINNGWTSNMSRQNNTSFGKTGTYYAEKWEPVGSYGVTQTINGMPAGVYRLSAHAKARSVISAKLYAAGIEQAITVADSESNYSVEFACDDNANVTIGFEGVGTEPKTDASWLCVDNFTLTLVSAGLPEVTAVEGKMNAEVAQAQTDAIAAYNTNKTVANYNAASAAITAAQSSKDAYTAANAALTKANTLLSNTNLYTTEAYNTFKGIVDNAQDGYDNGTLTTEEANAVNSTIFGTGWHSTAAVDDFLLSAWDVNPRDWSTYHVNTWSTIGDSGNPNFVAPCIEYWIGDAFTLADKVLTATLPDFTPGAEYKVTATICLGVNTGVDASTEPTGVTLQLNDGTATACAGTRIAETRFYEAEYEAAGTIGLDGKLNIKINVASTNVSWMTFRNVKYEKTADATAPTTDELTALDNAINAVKNNVGGFDKDEYAPYNNIEAFAALAAAQAANRESQIAVTTATTALTGATWTANTEELNAFYDGTFAIQPESTTGPTALAGWNNPEGIRQLIKNTDTDPGLNSASDKAAVFAWGNTTLTYGKTEGYTMPLEANYDYELSFKTCGWRDGDMGYVKVSVLNAANEGLAETSSVTATKRIGEENPWDNFKTTFTTGDAGNYTFGMWTSKHTVFTDLMLKKLPTYYIVGLGNDWTTDYKMTQSTEEGKESIYTFTTQVNVFGNEEAKYFEYKLREGHNWGDDVYQLPAQGQGNNSWSATEGNGIYTLTFTADIASNTVNCVAEKTADFTFAVVGSKDDGSEAGVANELFSTVWNTATTTEVMTKKADGTYFWEKEAELEAQTVNLKVVAQGLDGKVRWYGNGDANVSVNIADAGTYYFTVNFDGTNVTASALAKQTYTLAGIEAVFGSDWDPTDANNDMTRLTDGSGNYTMTYTDVELTANTTIKYKVVENHAWTPSWGMSDRQDGNGEYWVENAGTYHITFTFNPTTAIDGTYHVMCAVIPASVTKSISDAGYATYCSPYALNFAESGLTAYIAEMNGAEVSFTEVTSVPANTGVLLKGSQGDYTIKTAVSSETNVDANKFIGTVTGTTAPVGSFVLLNGEKGVGFYKTTAEFTVGAHTAYLPALASTARFIGFGFDETTGVEGITADRQMNNEIYDLQGRRVTNVKKGLYIVNGKKVVMK